MKSVLAACLLAWPACAAAPRLVPTRDVTVAYSVHPRDLAPLELRVSIAAGGAKLRITAQDLPTAFLVDRPLHTATVLLPMLKLFATYNIGRFDPENTVLRGARFERHGRERLAGKSCTDWTAMSAQGTASACITEDGVILRGHASDRHGELGTLLASTVEYGPLPPQLFERPSGYTDAGTLPIGVTGLKQ